MSNDKLQLGWPAGEHPSLELLRQYHEDTLPVALQHRVERHLLDCDLCADALEGMALSTRTQSDAATQEINARLRQILNQKSKEKVTPFNWMDWRAAAAILVILFASVLVIYYQVQEQKIKTQQPELAQQVQPIIQAAPPAFSSDTASETKLELIASASPESKPGEPFASVKKELSAKTGSSEELAEFSTEAEMASNTKDSNKEVLAAADEIPAPSATESVSEEVMVKANTKQMALAPESVDVARALSGKVAGVASGKSLSFKARQQHSKTITGKVLSSTGEPLPGAAVIVKGTTTGTATDSEGNFTLQLPPDKQTISINYIGYTSQEKKVEDNAVSVTIILHENTMALSELVVTEMTKDQPASISARPIAGMKAYKKYLAESIRLAKKTENINATGKVIVRFTVLPDGRLADVQVTKSLCPACDAEAVRLVKEGPAWQPAIQNGTAVSQEVKVAVWFKQ